MVKSWCKCESRQPCGYDDMKLVWYFLEHWVPSSILGARQCIFFYFFMKRIFVKRHNLTNLSIIFGKNHKMRKKKLRNIVELYYSIFAIFNLNLSHKFDFIFFSTQTMFKIVKLCQILYKISIKNELTRIPPHENGFWAITFVISCFNGIFICSSCSTIFLNFTL